MIKTEGNANIAVCSLSESAHNDSVGMSFAYAVRFFAYCIFYYFYYFFESVNPQRTQAVN